MKLIALVFLFSGFVFGQAPVPDPAAGRDFSTIKDVKRFHELAERVAAARIKYDRAVDDFNAFLKPWEASCRSKGWTPQANGYTNAACVYLPSGAAAAITTDERGNTYSTPPASKAPPAAVPAPAPAAAPPPVPPVKPQP